MKRSNNQIKAQKFLVIVGLILSMAIPVCPAIANTCGSSVKKDNFTNVINFSEATDKIMLSIARALEKDSIWFNEYALGSEHIEIEEELDKGVLKILRYSSSNLYNKNIFRELNAVGVYLDERLFMLGEFRHLQIQDKQYLEDSFGFKVSYIEADLLLGSNYLSLLNVHGLKRSLVHSPSLYSTLWPLISAIYNDGRLPENYSTHFDFGKVDSDMVSRINKILSESFDSLSILITTLSIMSVKDPKQAYRYTVIASKILGIIEDIDYEFKSKLPRNQNLKWILQEASGLYQRDMDELNIEALIQNLNSEYINSNIDERTVERVVEYLINAQLVEGTSYEEIVHSIMGRRTIESVY